MLTTERPTAERLLERAIAVIEERGAAAIRVHDIARDCGVTATTLYRLFGSRERFVHEAQAARFRELMNDDAVVAERLVALGSREAFAAAIDQLIDHYFSAAFNVRRRRTRLFILGSSEGDAELQALIASGLAHAHDATIAAFEEIQRRGWIRPDLDCFQFITWFTTFIDGRTRLEFPGVGLDLAAFDRYAKRIVLRELFGPEA